MKKILYASAIYFLILISNKVFAQWEPMNNGIDSTSPGMYIGSFVVSGNRIFVGTFCDIYYSLNYGETWESLKVPLKDSLISQITVSLAVNGNTIVAGFPSEGVYISTDYGNNWALKRTLSGDMQVTSVFINKDTIFVGTDKGIYISPDIGSFWIDRTDSLLPRCVYAFAKYKSSILTAGCGVCLTTNNGISWSIKSNGLDNAVIRTIVVNGDNLLVGNDNGNVFLSTNTGETWSNKSYGLPGIDITSLAIKGDTILATPSLDGVYLSTNNGDSWTSKNVGYPFPALANSLLIYNDFVFVGTSHGIYRAKLSDLTTDVKDTPTSSDPISLFPNPATDNININLSDDAQFIESIEIYDQLGRLQTSETSNTSEITGRHTIFVGALPPSVYFIKITTQNTIIYKKFIKM